MKFRLTIIILIGVIATGLTYYLNSSSDNSDAQFLNLNKPFQRKEKIQKIKAEKIPAAPLIKEKFSATHRSEARVISKVESQRQNPFAPLSNLESIHNKIKKQAGENEESTVTLPPPPHEQGGLLPPPPVLSGMNLPPEPGQSISTSELPMPPESQELSKKLSLNAVVGDKVILAFNDSSYARTHDFNKFITLGRGDQFESVKLLSISNDKVILEENGLTHELKISDIR